MKINQVMMYPKKDDNKRFANYVINWTVNFCNIEICTSIGGFDWMKK